MGYSSSAQNSRIFAPVTILRQDTRRIEINLAGQTLPTGITNGSVIRFDPLANGYTLSKADNEINAEVLGIVESTNGTDFNVVISGSINYSKLNEITEGSSGGVDILFLNPNVAGGLTGTIEVPASGSAIIKPVFQRAPHGNYNGIVVNYIGYKAGESVQGSDFNFAGQQSIAPQNASPGVNWIAIKEDTEFTVSDYPDLYSVYGVSGGAYTELVTVSTTAGMSSSLNKTATQILNGVLTTVGVVSAYDTVEKTFTLQKSQGTPNTEVGAILSIGNNRYSVTAQSVLTFVVPGREPEGTQGDTELIYWLLTKPTTSITIPTVFTAQSATFSGTVGVGAIADLENKINTLESRISTLEGYIRGA